MLVPSPSLPLSPFILMGIPVVAYFLGSQQLIPEVFLSSHSETLLPFLYRSYSF